MKISTALQAFISLYGIIQSDDISEHMRVGDNLNKLIKDCEPCLRPIIARINSGDCFTAAVAVGKVLAYHGLDVTYYVNDHHAYFKVDGRYYDTLNIDGTDDPSTLLGESVSKGKICSEQTLIEKHIHVDNTAIALINWFHFIMTTQPLDLPQRDDTYTVTIAKGRKWISYK